MSQKSQEWMLAAWHEVERPCLSLARCAENGKWTRKWWSGMRAPVLVFCLMIMWLFNYHNGETWDCSYWASGHMGISLNNHFDEWTQFRPNCGTMTRSICCIHFSLSTHRRALLSCVFRYIISISMSINLREYYQVHIMICKKGREERRFFFLPQI